MALWDSPRQREAYDWFALELANLRTAFRWAADQDDLDVAAPIATYVGWLGALVQTFEPIAWAEEMIEPARAVDHPRLAFLLGLRRSAGCLDESRRLSATPTLGKWLWQSGDAMPFSVEGMLGALSSPSVNPTECRVVSRPARTPPRHPSHIRS